MNLKSFFTRSILSSLATIVLGLVLILYPSASAATLGRLIGIIVVAMGVAAVASYLTKKTARKNDGSFAYGMTLIALGLYAVIRYDFMLTLIPFLFGFCILGGGFMQMQTLIELHRTRAKNVLPFAVTSTVSLILGLIAILQPFASLKALFITIGVALVFTGIMLIVSDVLLGKLKND